MKRFGSLVLFCLGLALLAAPLGARADRIKDLTHVAAKRTNQLIGHGLVVGLQGPGDGSDVPVTGQSLYAIASPSGLVVGGCLAGVESATRWGWMGRVVWGRIVLLLVVRCARGPRLVCFSAGSVVYKRQVCSWPAASMWKDMLHRHMHLPGFC